jgi:hypothetical protein
MNRIRTALKSYAGRYLEAMAYADPIGLGYYALEPIADGPYARRTDEVSGARGADTARRRQPTAIAA